MEPIGDGLSLGRGGEQGAFVGSKDFQPMREVGGMVGAGLVRDAEIRAEEGGSQLGHKFLGGVGGFVKPAFQSSQSTLKQLFTECFERTKKHGDAQEYSTSGNEWQQPR